MNFISVEISPAGPRLIVRPTHEWHINRLRADVIVGVSPVDTV
jgi:hypothetical protein